jgi:hypothetical protein
MNVWPLFSDEITTVPSTPFWANSVEIAKSSALAKNRQKNGKY